MRIETTTTVKCDGPNCRERGVVVNELPDNWYLIKQADSDGKLPTDRQSSSLFAFHALTCVEKWAKERRRVIRSALPVIPLGRPDNGNETIDNIVGHLTKVN